MSEPRNPPAFPGIHVIEMNSGEIRSGPANGMTLRDFMAAAALNGLLSKYGPEDAVGPNPFKSLSITAYGYADAMLAEREKTK